VAVAEHQALLDLAIEVAREAGALLLDAAERLATGVDLEVGTKSSATDPVSAADRASEDLIAGRLSAARPEDGLIGEEDRAPRTSRSGLTWVVDPLDGTVNFLYGIPTWCVSIACVDADGGLVAVVHDPNRDETFVAVRGGGAWLGERRLGVTGVDDLAATLVATGFAYDPVVRAVQGRWVAELVTRVRDVRRSGSAALDLAWVAAGRVDAFLEVGLGVWDWAAGGLLVTEAGGRVSHHARIIADRELPEVLAAGGGIRDLLAAFAGEELARPDLHRPANRADPTGTPRVGRPDTTSSEDH
jgi:myo-inositol-1(or 4)-monophosphatase